MKNLIFSFLLILTNSGCAYFGVGAIGEVVYSGPRQDYGFNMLKSDLKVENRSKPYQYREIVAEWGEPSTIIDKHEIKSVVYYNGLRWRGVVLVPLIPLPFVMPVGFKTVTFNFRNDFLIDWIIDSNHYCFSLSGIFLIPLGGEFVGSLTPESFCQWHNQMSPNEGKMECDVPFYDKCYPSGAGSRGSDLKK